MPGSGKVATPQSRLDLLMSLIRIPGVSASPQEDETARFIHSYLASLDLFKTHPEYLALAPTPLEGDKRPLHSVVALVTSDKPTKRTIILTGHLDVVGTEAYGALRAAAFDPDALAAGLRSEGLAGQAAVDLASGNYLFARGSMDMKCGVAIEMELIRDFAENRGLFDVNLLLVIVPDEENVSAGMRGAAPILARMQKQMDLEYLAAINAEPTEAGLPGAVNPTVFLGTVGKLMPAFLCLGRESHVGAYYEGISAALLAARIVTVAEGNPALADASRGQCCPSWICLENRVLREGYSVTVPGAAVVYFNCYATTNSPEAVLAQMRNVARQAARETLEQIKKSLSAMTALGLEAGCAVPGDIPVYSVEEIRKLAEAALGKAALEKRLEEFMDSLEEPDPREAAISLMRELASCAGMEGPLVMPGFLPPYYPPRNSLGGGKREEALRRAVDDLIAEAADKFAVTVDMAPYFTGLCDLSYFGFQGRPGELAALEKNLPGWGKIYSVPIEALAELNVPVLNFGPSGRDPHKKTERLEKNFSLEQYPVLLEFLIRAIARNNP